MLKVVYFSDYSNIDLENKVNEFLEKEVKIISIIPFGTQATLRCQVLYEVDGPGSKLVKPLAKPAEHYTETDRLDTVRSE